MKRSKFNLSSYKLFTGDMGKLYPISFQEVLPGDTFQGSTSLLMRFSPLIAPIMHPVQVRVHHWFVPNRLIWDDWEDFITDQNTMKVPTVNAGLVSGRLGDYLGLPPNNNAMTINSLPFRAYNLIWNEFYRDQDLQTEADISASSHNQLCRSVSWEKDNFTSARPWTQKGAAVTVPIGLVGSNSPPGGYITVETPDGPSYLASTPGDNNIVQVLGSAPDNNNMKLNISDIEVNEFRKAFALQRYAEARARYGSRYTEYLQYLGVRPSDARLQRPEYLGGGKSNVNISEVLQSAPGSAEDDFSVGDIYGHGIAAMRSNSFRKFFQEHGIMLTLVSVRPKAIYADGIERYFLKQDKEDFYQKELQHIGQQEVYNAEVYADGTPSDEDVFGYQDRYYEYKTKPSKISTEFRDWLDYYHLARKFESRPALNESFITCDPSKRIFQEQNKNSLWCMASSNIVARRLVKKSPVSRIV